MVVNLVVYLEVVIVILVELIYEVFVLFNLNVVKVVIDIDGLVLIFSCVFLFWVCDVFVCDCDSLLEGVFYCCYIGIYVYCVGFFVDFVVWGLCWLENVESFE